MELANNSDGITMSASEPTILFMISEELKSRKFFNTLLELGLDNSHYQPHLDEAILSCLGITDESNATYDFYFNVMNEHSEKIGVKEESVLEQAKEVLAKLRGIAGQAREGAES